MTATSTLRAAEKPALLTMDLVSVDTILYLGLTEETADFIWQDRCKQFVRSNAARFGDQLGDSFLGILIEYVSENGHVADTCADNDRAWARCMNRCGLDRPAKKAIMDPIFKGTRLTQSCLYWVIDTIEQRFKALQRLRAADQAPPPPQQDRATHQGASVPRASQPTETAMSAAVLQAGEDPAASSSITLYKGIDRASVGRFFDEGDLLRIRDLATPAPTRAHRFASEYRFYVDRDVAEQEACYIRRRSDLTPVVLVQATIHKSVLEAAYKGPRRQEVYWPSEEWKSLLFHCRRGGAAPHDLVRYFEASLLVVTATAKASRFFQRMVKGTDQIGEDAVLKNKRGEDAVQYCFRRPGGDHFLAQHAELKMLPFTDEEFWSWCAESRGEGLEDIPWFRLTCSIDCDTSHEGPCTE